MPHKYSMLYYILYISIFYGFFSTFILFCWNEVARPETKTWPMNLILILQFLHCDSCHFSLILLFLHLLLRLLFFLRFSGISGQFVGNHLPLHRPGGDLRPHDAKARGVERQPALAGRLRLHQQRLLIHQRHHRKPAR